MIHLIGVYNFIFIGTEDGRKYFTNYALNILLEFFRLIRCLIAGKCILNLPGNVRELLVHSLNHSLKFIHRGGGTQTFISCSADCM